MSSQHDDFDPKYSLVYLNSTAALMETMFKNMKDEDFVYPSKKQVGADEGAVIRSEEHLKRQRETAMQNSYLVPDTYLESVLSKMTDEDFTYGSNKPVDPNYGRVVRALELMELTGTSTETKTMEAEPVTKSEETEVPQKENVTFVIKPEIPKYQPDAITQPVKQAVTHDQPNKGRANKSFGGYKKRQSYKGGVKYDLQTWRNDGCSFTNDQGVEMKQSKKWKRNSMNNQPTSSSNNNAPMANNTTYSYSNPVFSPQNGLFNGYGNNGAAFSSANNGASSSSTSNGNRYRNGNGGYSGYRGNSQTNGDCRAMNGHDQSSNVPRMEFWNDGYNDSQQSWR
ncbi:unnamed protein product [Caenorhabditis brenneri]